MLLTPSDKYAPFPPLSLPDRQWPGKILQQAPRWLSTDLRDGNQALAEPMDSNRKKLFWQLLLQCGLKEIEVAFPSASLTDFNFVHELIEEKLIPDGVTIQVLTQARSDFIDRTFVALEGARHATLHLYNATAPVFRKLVFRQSREEIVALAVSAARQIRLRCASLPETHWTFEYSPETFCFTEMDFTLHWKFAKPLRRSGSPALRDP